MPKITHFQAREMLRQACTRYISHKKSQLNDFIGQSPYSADSAPTFFLQAIDKNKPSPGFNDWARCWYYSTLKSMFSISTEHCMASYIDNTPSVVPMEQEIEPGYYYRQIPFKQIKSYQPEYESLDQHDPQVVLYNLDVLIDVLNYIMRDNLNNWASLKENFGYRESDYAYTEASPFSLKIDTKLNQLDAFVRLIKSLPEYQSNYTVSALSRKVQQGRYHFSLYLKEIVVVEIKNILDDASLNDVNALKNIELQLKDYSTLAI